VVWAALYALGGCVSLPPVVDDGLEFAERRARLEALSGWEMRGRLAVDTGERAYQGRFRWRKNADRLMLSVRGPLGTGSFEVSGSPSELTVRAKGETWVLDDPEIELSQRIGWWLPVGSLGAWLIGVPDRKFESQSEQGPPGVLASLEQRLWRLDYDSYQLAEGMLVPRNIDMSHGAIELRLTVDAFSSVPSPRDALN